jgi:hypothetical protein
MFPNNLLKKDPLTRLALCIAMCIFSYDFCSFSKLFKPFSSPLLMIEKLCYDKKAIIPRAVCISCLSSKGSTVV